MKGLGVSLLLRVHNKVPLETYDLRLLVDKICSHVFKRCQRCDLSFTLVLNVGPLGFRVELNLQSPK